MRIAVFGLGYVGSVSAACLANDGHDVIGVDVQRDKVDAINAGKSLVSEPGLAELVVELAKSKKLRATTCSREAVQASDMSLICVGTPSNDNGSLKLNYVESVAKEIGAALADFPGYHVVCVRSTVLPGTTEDFVAPILEKASGKKRGQDFGLCMNPEFLREGVAIADYREPSQIVMGQFDERSGRAAMCMYEGIEATRVHSDIKTAESVKYVCNTFHALKVAFANEIGNICKAHDVDGQDVMRIFCNDRRLNISDKYLSPGFAFGGSCLPKDCRALIYRAQERDVETPLLRSIMESNQLQIARGIRMVEQSGKKKIGILGLSFKASTDDVRESPVIPMVETLVGRGYDVSIYDPCVKPEEIFGANELFLRGALPHFAKLMRADVASLMAESEVVVITNGSKEFNGLVDATAGDKVVIDLHGLAKNENGKHGNYQGICW
jgi:GDP-mannose 6-dehydrogenase